MATVVMLLFMACFLWWLWSIGSFLWSIAPSGFRGNTGLFRGALGYTAIEVLLFMAVFSLVASVKDPPLAAVWALVIIFPLHFFAMFCLVYACFFIAKHLVLAETGRPVQFSDYIGPLLLMWFHLIGIWIIQPRVNRLYAARGNTGPVLVPSVPISS